MIVQSEARSKQGGVEIAARATRFSMEMPIRYRRAGEKGWHEGVTENMSRSGALFRSDCTMERDSELQMGFILPVEAPGGSGAEVECRGRVVRVEKHAGKPYAFRVAATISDYRFVRAG